MTSATWRNWAGNQTAQPRRTALPRTPGEVAAEVRRAAADGLRVRMTGTGHSFSPAAVTDGVLLRPGGLTAIRSVDAAAGLVTAEAGCPLRVLNSELAARGLSLVNMGDVDVQTVAGAIQSGTHGTGRASGGLAAQVAALELVLADGTIVTCQADPAAAGPGPSTGTGAPGGPGQLPGLFDAARVGLGALGIVTAVTFRVVPAFLLQAREEPMRWPEVIARLDELTAQNEHFEFYWFPHTDGCLTKRNNTVPGPPQPLGAMRYLLEDEIVSNTLFGAACRAGQALPGLIPAVNGVAARALRPRCYTDAAYRVFTSPRRVRFTEQEYGVPRESAAGVLGELRALIARRDWRISFPVEVRFTPGDDPWLSTAYGRDTAYIAVHMFHASPNQPYFADVEAVMTAARGRPHWGKMHTANAGYLRREYPMHSRFAALRDELDPQRRFANTYLTEVLGP